MSEDKYDWDVLVLGGGTAGIVASRTAAALGARTALVERARTGGDCLWTGCVPSKALLAAARRAVDARTAPALGVRTGEVAVDFAAVMNHVRAAIKAIEPDDSPETLRTAGVHVVTGEARFVGADTCAVAGGAVRFRHAVIATGGRPVVPAVPGLADARPLTSETVWDLDVLPERLVVLGAGSVGCELGQAFARLGSRVTLVEALPRILPAEDPEASETVLSSLRHDGVRVLTGSRATGCRAGPDGSGELVVSTGEPASTGQGLAFDRILMAVGRRPGTADLAPDRAGVELDEDGFVRVDRRLRTTNPRVWAAGDVTAISAFTHTAGVHAGVAAGNAVLGLRRSVDLDAEPRVTFTDPEVAAVGAATWPSVDGEEPRTLTVHHTEVDRAVTDQRTDGFSRVTLGPRSKVTGATVVGPRAGESLAELTLAVRKGMRVGDLAATTHPYPTYGDGVWNAAVANLYGRLADPRAQRVLGTWVRARRTLTDWRSR